MRTGRKQLLLRRLFIGSIVFSMTCAVAWWMSSRHRIAFIHTAATGRTDVRLREGAIYLTIGDDPLSAPLGWQSLSRTTVADPWPELAWPHTYWTLLKFPSDPSTTAFLGFVCVSKPGIDVLAVPFWALIALSAMYQAWWVFNGRLLRGRMASGHCVNCGYDLRQLDSLRCPECGHQFSSGKVEALPAAAGRMRKHEREARVST